MNRVVVSRPMCGLFGMQVCAVSDATDKEILQVCNTENPSGTASGWGKVIRTEKDFSINTVPVECKDHVDRMHFIVLC